MQDDALLQQMLEQTRDENLRDRASAATALEQQDWQALDEPDLEALITDFSKLSGDIILLEQSINHWLGSPRQPR